MQTVSIELGHARYPIHIGAGLIDRSTLGEHCSRQTLVVTNDTVAPLYLDTVMRAMPAEASSVVLPDGERFKTLDTLDLIFEALLAARFDRGCTLLALGGGVIGDMTGFAAASYQRGVAFVQVPTTLLAQVDSSVGGKTGVNHRRGKNMIGAFHQPRAVIADMTLLDSLPRRELVAGLAEVIKHGLILDADFFGWLEDNIEALLARDPIALGHAVQVSCEIKARVVEADEREHGQRALLNLGHTFGHAIEAALGYGTWLHGEAISVGMVMAMGLSERLGRIDASTRQRGEALLARAGLPLHAPSELTTDTLIDYMTRDKKVSDGQLRFILLDALGQAVVTADVPPPILRTFLDDCLARRSTT